MVLVEQKLVCGENDGHQNSSPNRTQDQNCPQSTSGCLGAGFAIHWQLGQRAAQSELLGFGSGK
jgi:hypothetical protein